mmetsp:Transcript_93249/g.290217  ORF Transcript_93249/g.290217 Transcript_93249/m.290217 type:complete len:247 (-) Transcript_93249:74-814(-)
MGQRRPGELPQRPARHARPRVGAEQQQQVLTGVRDEAHCLWRPGRRAKAPHRRAGQGREERRLGQVQVHASLSHDGAGHEPEGLWGRLRRVGTGGRSRLVRPVTQEQLCAGPQGFEHLLAAHPVGARTTPQAGIGPEEVLHRLRREALRRLQHLTPGHSSFRGALAPQHFAGDEPEELWVRLVQLRKAPGGRAEAGTVQLLQVTGEAVTCHLEEAGHNHLRLGKCPEQVHNQRGVDKLQLRRRPRC